MPFRDAAAKAAYMKSYRVAHRPASSPALKAVGFDLIGSDGNPVDAGRVVPGVVADLCPSVCFGDTEYFLVGAGKGGAIIFQAREPEPVPVPVPAPTDAEPDSQVHPQAEVRPDPGQAETLMPNESTVFELDGSPSILGSRYIAAEALWDRRPTPAPPTEDEGRVAHTTGDPDESPRRRIMHRIVRR